MRALDCRVPGSNGGRPTCHAHCPDCLDDLDLAVGLSSGEGGGGGRRGRGRKLQGLDWVGRVGERHIG